MEPTLPSSSSGEERAELEAVLQAIGKSSRLALLLDFVGKRYLAGECDALSEYTIATEVFGRSKRTFDASQDAIARVEAHRLRRRLKDFYEGPGRDHAIQISIPPGSYVPLFSKRTVQPALNAASVEIGMTPVGRPESSELPAEPVHPPAGSESKIIRGWILTSLALVSIAVASAGIYMVHSRTPSHAAENRAGTAPALEQPAPLASTESVVRMLAGYTGEPQTDSSGAVWGPERFVTGGGSWRRLDTPLVRTGDPLLFQYWHTGDSTWDIPLRPGVYELHLYFVASTGHPEWTPRGFLVYVNGNLLLESFDIANDAMGDDVGDERVFRDISPADDGKLHLRFANQLGVPQINAIEILPGTPHKQLPIRLVTQRTPVTDHKGQFWHSDDYYSFGELSVQRQEISGSADPDLFTAERYGHFSYAIPVDTRDRYTVILHFVEFYFGSGTAGGGVGSRVFKVMCNGQTLLDDFDIYKEAGSRHELIKTFSHMKPSAQGKLNLTFEPIVNNATVSGIEVIDESR